MQLLFTVRIWNIILERKRFLGKLHRADLVPDLRVFAISIFDFVAKFSASVVFVDWIIWSQG